MQSRTWLVGLGTLLMVACGADPATPGPGPVTQLITPAGATLIVAGRDGGQLTLVFPAGAVAASVSFTVTPLAPRAGVSVEFGMEPAGMELLVPLELRFDPAPAGVVLPHFFWANARDLAALETRQGAVIEASTRVIGYPLGNGQALRSTQAAAPAANGASLAIGPLECQARGAAIGVALGMAGSEDDFDAIERLDAELEALTASCDRQLIAQLETAACTGRTAAVAAARTATVTNDTVFFELFRPIIGTSAHVQITGGVCPGNDAVGDMITKLFNGVLAFLRMEIGTPGFASGFLDRSLRGLLDLASRCQLAGIDESVCGRFASELYAPVLDLMREAAYQDCLDDGTALSLSQLFEVGRGGGSEGAFFGSGNFSYAEIEDDVAHCTSSHLEIAVFDALPELLPDAGAELDSRGMIGAPSNTAEVTAPRDGSLTIGGAVRALVCPNASLSDDELVFSIRGVEIARSPRSGNTYAISTNPVSIVVQRDLATARLDPATASSFVVDIVREGTACGIFSTEHKMFSVTVTIGAGAGLAIDPSETTLMPGNARLFTATLDGAPADVIWSANGGTISSGGSYVAGTTAGDFLVTATLRSDAAIRTTARVSIVTLGPERKMVGTVIIDYTFTLTVSQSSSDLSPCGSDAVSCTSMSTTNVSGSLNATYALISLAAPRSGMVTSFNPRTDAAGDPLSTGNGTLSESGLISNSASFTDGCRRTSDGLGSFSGACMVAPGARFSARFTAGTFQLDIGPNRSGTNLEIAFQGSGSSSNHVTSTAMCSEGAGDVTTMGGPTAATLRIRMSPTRFESTSVSGSTWVGSATVDRTGVDSDCAAMVLATDGATGKACSTSITATWDLRPEE